MAKKTAANKQRGCGTKREGEYLRLACFNPCFTALADAGPRRISPTLTCGTAFTADRGAAGGVAENQPDSRLDGETVATGDLDSGPVNWGHPGHVGTDCDDLLPLGLFMGKRMFGQENH